MSRGGCSLHPSLTTLNRCKNYGVPLLWYFEMLICAEEYHCEQPVCFLEDAVIFSQHSVITGNSSSMDRWYYMAHFRYLCNLRILCFYDWILLHWLWSPFTFPLEVLFCGVLPFRDIKTSPFYIRTRCKHHTQGYLWGKIEWTIRPILRNLWGTGPTIR
jgi:hypothetical protein